MKLVLRSQFLQFQMQDFLSPTSFVYQKVPPRSEPDEYLRKNKNNIMAEFWMLVNSPSPHTFELTTTTMVDQHSEAFTGVTSIFNHKKKPHDRTSKVIASVDKEPEVVEFHKHFGVINGRYCLLMFTNTTNGGADMRIYSGSTCPKNHAKSIDEFSQYEMNSACPKRIAFFDYGFIGDAMNEVRACQDLQSQLVINPGFHTNTMLHCVADPTKRITAGYLEATPASLRAVDFAPANEGQTKAIQDLKLTVEGIQGPPGTGKSTVIAHILRSSIPPSEVSLVTCVQNKAIDAIAEKLRYVDSVPFFVVGNVKRLGLIAQQWTIEKQVVRDPRVVSLTRTLDHYKRRVKEETKFVMKRQNVLNTSYLLSRREHLAKSKFNKRESEMSDEENDSYQAWLVVDPWHRVWKAYISNKYFHKLSYVRSMRLKITAMEEELGLLLAEVRSEIIQNARAILATTATASGSLANNDELAPAFSKLRTIILDEAGTVPETKLPLLISLNPTEMCRIVAIGDQNQLTPFSRLSNTIPNSGHSGGNVCFAFAQRGFCARGRSCRFEHVRGSPVRRASGGVVGSSDGEPPLGFFQRLEKALPPRSIPTLTEQFRMHPSVCDFVSDTFYNGSLMTNPVIDASRRGADSVGLWWVTYSDTDAESSPPRSTSKINETEVYLTLSLLDREDLVGKSVMVITFYKAQETLMKRMLESTGREESESLRILSVDQSQGSEADVVILSCVRSNAENNIGFVKNMNRMNVAVSRMKYQLIIIGCHSTLCTDAKWKSLYLKAQKPVGGTDAIPLLLPGRLR